MRALLVALGVAVSLAVGWLLGASGLLPGRAAREGGGARRAPIRAGVPDAREVERLRLEAARVPALEAENSALKERVAELGGGQDDARVETEAPAPGEGEEELAPGTRLPDGSIVGGAQWPPMFVRTATGYVEQLMSEFLDEAKLDPAQEQRLRTELHQRIGSVMELSAAFTNGDLTGDETYERMTAIAQGGRGRLLELLDDAQAETYRRFERKLVDRMHDQIVHGEMVTLDAELHLDPDQEAKVRAVISDRWRRVQQRIATPVPNVMFKPIRRQADADIYRDTAAAVRALLTPDQQARFDREEQQADQAVFTYRAMLVPKVPETR